MRPRFLEAITVGVLLVAGVAGVAAESGSPPASHPAGSVGPPLGPVRLVDLRVVEIPDSRLISMSPDGRWIAAGRLARQHEELCIYDVDTLEQQSCADLSPLDAGIRLDDVIWAPDSSKLAFGEEAFKLFVDGDLWLMDVLTGSLTNLDDDGFEGDLPFLDEPVEGTITIAVSPAFTPDSQAVTFSRSLFVDGEMGGNEIATVPISGGALKRLTLVDRELPGVVYLGMRWAPDGSRLYYSVHHPGMDHPDNGIWAVEADGSGARQLLSRTDPEGGAPAVVQVSPRGDRLLAFDPLKAASRAGSGPLFALFDPESRALEPVTPPVTGDRRVAYVSHAVVSPDGSALLMVTRGVSPDFQVHVRDLETGAVTPIVPGGLPSPLGPSIPTWSVHGRVFLAGPSFQGHLLVLDGAGGSPNG